MSRMRTVTVTLGRGSDAQKAEVSVIDQHIWMTFLGPRGGRQYTLPLSADGANALGRVLMQARSAVNGFDR